MKTFKSWKSYYQFETAVKTKNRYIYDSDVKDFLQTVVETSISRIEEVKEGSILYRAQIGSNLEPHYYEENEYIDIPSPLDSQRMKPLKDAASEGRANPKGISYMYLSTDKDTAMAEVRPWVGSFISIAQFKLLKKIRLINCTSEHKDRSKILIYTEKGVEPEVEPKKREGFVWKDIDKAFSIPVTLNETTADYAPTQIIAELFKNEGLDGIAYRSSLGKGHNVTLFNLDTADLINCPFLYRADKISFSFSKL